MTDQHTQMTHIPDERMTLRKAKRSAGATRWSIGDLPLQLEARHSPRGWTLLPQAIPSCSWSARRACAWLEKHDLRGKSFATRKDAVRLVQALLLDDPLPYASTSALARVIQVAPNRWKSVDDHWLIIGNATQGFSVIERCDSGEWPQWSLPTLRAARVFLAAHDPSTRSTSVNSDTN